MPTLRRNLLLLVIALAVTATLRADVVGEALFSFPTQTEYLEYDNLASLRKLSTYNSLRQNFSGRTLEEAKSVLEQLGIQETQVQEVVVGSSATAAYGLITGQFSGAAVAKNRKTKDYATKLLDTQAFCTGRETCIVFLEDSLAAFGSAGDLKDVLLTRQGVVTHLSANSDAVHLLNTIDRTAPVRGILFGQQLQSTVADFLRDLSGRKTDLSRLTSTISGVGYGVTFDSEAHMSATIECASTGGAAMLSQMMTALGALQAVAAPAIGDAAGMRIQNLRASSSDNLVHLKADTVVPTTDAARSRP